MLINPLTHPALRLYSANHREILIGEWKSLKKSLWKSCAEQVPDGNTAEVTPVALVKC